MRILKMICAAAIAMCGTVGAQTSQDLITVHFSTPVMVGNAMLPAGECSIQVIRGSSDNVILAVRSASGIAASVLVNRISNSTVETNGRISVILGRRNNVYQLTQIQLPDHTGFQVLD